MAKTLASWGYQARTKPYATFRAQAPGRNKDMLFTVTYTDEEGAVVDKITDIPLMDPVPFKTVHIGEEYNVVVVYRMEVSDDQD
jgi:hypothetical protein